MTYAEEVARILREQAEADARRKRMAADAEWSAEDVDHLATEIMKKGQR